MKSFLSYLTKLDRHHHSLGNLGTFQTPEKNPNKKIYRTLLATTLIASSQFLAVMSASSNPIPTPVQPSPVVPTRTILNGSFEQPVVTSWTGSSSTTGSANANVAGGNIPESYNSPGLPVVWRSTEQGTNSGGQYDYKNAVEVWRGKPNNQIKNATAEGVQYAELNGSDNAALYQDLCVLPSESVTWSLKHAARIKSSSNPINIMRVSITDPSDWGNSKTPPATKPYESGDLSVSYDDAWKPHQDTWTSNNTSIKPLRFAFQAIQGSDGNNTYGNFIDNVNLNLSPIIDFLPTNGGNVNIASTTEGNTTTYYFLSLRINGIMKTAGTVKIKLTGLNARRSFRLGDFVGKGSGGASAPGLTATQSSTRNNGEITLTIPAGTYDPNVVSNYIHIPIDFSDTESQTNDNLTFTLSNPTGGGQTVAPAVADLQIASTSCLGTSRTTVTTLLQDDDYVQRVQLPLPLTVAVNRVK
jgi:hypothetical protein